MMEWMLQKLSTTFQHLVPQVRADDSEGELQDPQTILRDECQSGECNKLHEKFESCNSRVRSKKKTTETCDEEFIDFINCLDHCVSKTLFSKLK